MQFVRILWLKNLQTPIPRLYIWKKLSIMKNEKATLPNSRTSEVRNNTVKDEQLSLLVNFGFSRKQYYSRSAEFEVERITPYPATPEEYGLLCHGFGGYRIELSPYRGVFSEIRFRGCGNGKEAVCGYIVDKNGCIESIALEPDNDEGYALLPLTPDSHALFASVPMQGGKPVWESITVQFASGSAIINDASC